MLNLVIVLTRIFGRDVANIIFGYICQLNHITKTYIRADVLEVPGIVRGLKRHPKPQYYVCIDGRWDLSVHMETKLSKRYYFARTAKNTMIANMKYEYCLVLNKKKAPIEVGSQ